MKSIFNWLKENLSNCLGFAGTVAMSIAITPSPEGNGMMLDGIDKPITPYALIQHGWLNQIGLILIGVGFFLPFFLRATRRWKCVMLLIVVSLYGGLISRFT